MHQVLAASPLFRGLTPQNIESLLTRIPYQVKQFEKDNVIAQRDQELRYLFILLEGTVRGEMLDFTGKTLKVEDIEAPRPIAIGFLFGQNNRYPVDVISNTHVKVLVLPVDSVVKLLQSNAIVLRNFLNAISNRAQFLSQRIWFLSFKTIKGKLAQYILSLVKADARRVELPLSQKELAEYFGVTRPSLARALGELEREGYIVADRRNIEIVNQQGLLQFVD